MTSYNISSKATGPIVTDFHVRSSGVRVLVGWLVVFGLNDPLRQYFSLYRVVSQKEGERGEKG